MKQLIKYLTSILLYKAWEPSKRCVKTGVCQETESFKGTEHEGVDVCEDGCVQGKPCWRSKLFGLIVLLLSTVIYSPAQTLPVNWTVSGTFVNPVVTITQDANNLVIKIGANQKAVAKTAFTKLTSPPIVVHDTAWRVLDPKQSADYLALAKNFTDAMAELETTTEALAEKRAENADLIRIVKQLKAEIARDTVIQLMIDPRWIISVKVKRP